MTIVNPDTARNLGLVERPDLPPTAAALIEAIGDRIVSPVLPPQLKTLGVDVAHNINDPSVSPQLIEDASAALNFIRDALGELPPPPPVVYTDEERDQMFTNLRFAARREDGDAKVLMGALGLSALPPDLYRA